MQTRIRLRRPHSEETRRKIGLANSVSLRGKKLSEEHRKKIGLSLVGRKVSEVTRKKIGASNSGKVRSVEARRKNSESNMGRIPWNKGKRDTADHIKSFSTIIEENKIRSLDEANKCEELWDIANGRTLCTKCHEKTETYGGYSKKKS